MCENYKNIVLGFEFEVEGPNQNIYNLIDNTSRITSITNHIINDYHGTKYLTGQGKWRIEQDESIKGAEFISPPLPYSVATKMCKEFFKAIDDTSGVSTTEACGLHVGMSVNGTLNGIVLKNIIPSINYRLLASLWPKRTIKKNHYCKNLKHIIEHVNIFEKTKSEKFDATNIKFDIQDISKRLMANSYSFIKTKIYNNVEYIEFRVPGGQDYHLKFNELFTAINHISDILLGRIALPKICINKKMCSYLNRAYKRADYGSYSCPKIPETFAKENITQGIFEQVYSTVMDILKIQSWRDTSDFYAVEFNKLNEYNYIYHLLKYMTNNCTVTMNDHLKSISNAINARISVSIPENEQQSDMVKMLLVWDMLPQKLAQDLIYKLNKRTCSYFIKHYLNKTSDKSKVKQMSDICKERLQQLSTSIN